MSKNLDILLVAATFPEVAFLLPGLKNCPDGYLQPLQRTKSVNIDLLVTGAGMVNTTYHLTQILQKKKYLWAINVGICGSLTDTLRPVQLVKVTTDQFADWGAWDQQQFLDQFQLKLAGKNTFPFSKGKLKPVNNLKPNCLNILKKVEGITVNSGTGSVKRQKQLLDRFGPVVESMEGAAFFFVCMKEEIPCVQVRSVSNIATKRKRESWKINEAIDALEGFVGLMLMEMRGKV
jgi:futalosine hydrolase